MGILKDKDPNTSITFEMRRRPLNAFPDIPDEGSEGDVGAGNDSTLSRRVRVFSNTLQIIFSRWIRNCFL